MHLRLSIIDVFFEAYTFNVSFFFSTRDIVAKKSFNSSC